MRLRRLLAVLFAAAILAGPALGPASATPKPDPPSTFTDFDGSCLDLTDGGATYPSGANKVHAEATVNSVCRGVDYTAIVYTPGGVQVGIGSAKFDNQGVATILSWDVNVARQSAPLCVSLQTSVNGTVYDVAPSAPIAPCTTGGPADENPPAGGWM